MTQTTTPTFILTLPNSVDLSEVANVYFTLKQNNVEIEKKTSDLVFEGQTQPLSAVDAYMIDDKVHYPNKEGSIYVSTVDNNVWEPGVYGWDEVI